jgi:ATP-dependent Clp protease ATP-binding subunit ClpA
VLFFAQEEAGLLNHAFIGTEHLLLGLLREEEGLAATALGSLGILLDVVRRQIEETIGPAGTAPTGAPPFTPRAKKAMELAQREALMLGHRYIGTEHILLGLIRQGEGVAAQVLVSLGVDLSSVRQQVIRLLSGYRPLLELPKMTDIPQPGEAWSARVVRAGRSPTAFAAAYDALAELARRMGLELGEERIHVDSVDTAEGPGLMLSLDHSSNRAHRPKNDPSHPVDQPATDS